MSRHVSTLPGLISGARRASDTNCAEGDQPSDHQRSGHIFQYDIFHDSFSSYLLSGKIAVKEKYYSARCNLPYASVR
jgi:hypothetical protein